MALLTELQGKIYNLLFNIYFQQKTKMISAKKRDLQQQMGQTQQGAGGLADPGREELQKLERTLASVEHNRERQERRIQVGLGG